MGISNQPLALSAGTLKGTTVKNRKGENLGHVEEVMIDVNSGHVAYVVVGFGGILGFGDKLFAVPWPAIEFDTDTKTAIMDAHKDLLEKAPGFDRNNWPSTPNGQWYNDLYRYYGSDPYWR